MADDGWDGEDPRPLSRKLRSGKRTRPMHPYAEVYRVKTWQLYLRVIETHTGTQPNWWWHSLRFVQGMQVVLANILSSNIGLEQEDVIEYQEGLDKLEAQEALIRAREDKLMGVIDRSTVLLEIGPDHPDAKTNRQKIWQLYAQVMKTQKVNGTPSWWWRSLRFLEGMQVVLANMLSSRIGFTADEFRPMQNGLAQLKGAEAHVRLTEDRVMDDIDRRTAMLEYNPDDPAAVIPSDGVIDLTE